MCFVGDTKVAPPAPPAEVLNQAGPEKKSANKRDANALAIGTKAYRNESGLGVTATKQKTRPTGNSVGT